MSRVLYICVMVKSHYIKNCHPLVRNPYKENINPYYWVDDHPLLNVADFPVGNV